MFRTLFPDLLDKCARTSSIMALLISLAVTTYAEDSESWPPKPGPGNTGLKVPFKSLTYSQSIRAATPGTVIENLYIEGSVAVEASDVTIRNCYINAKGALYAIRATTKGTKNVLIEDSEIRNAKSSIILGSGFTIRRCNIWDSGGDLIKPADNFLIENNWLHHTGSLPGAHGDGVQMVRGTNGIIRWNNFDLPSTVLKYANSQCIIGGTQTGPLTDIIVTQNWINGGGNSVNIGSKKGQPVPTNIEISNNLFGRDMRFSPITGSKTNWVSCNRWEDTLEFLPDQDSIEGCSVPKFPGQKVILSVSPGAPQVGLRPRPPLFIWF